MCSRTPSSLCSRKSSLFDSPRHSLDYPTAITTPNYVSPISIGETTLNLNHRSDRVWIRVAPMRGAGLYFVSVELSRWKIALNGGDAGSVVPMALCTSPRAMSLAKHIQATIGNTKPLSGPAKHLSSLFDDAHFCCRFNKCALAANVKIGDPGFVSPLPLRLQKFRCSFQKRPGVNSQETKLSFSTALIIQTRI